ncbi:MAG: SLATT domain-containing protein [Chitinivibrionales bacterium]|nr:SLATT domain-containing protein [Chitinivibrionales bacterium]
MDYKNVREWYIGALHRQFGHRAAELRFMQRHRILGGSNQILTVVVGTSAFGAIMSKFTHQWLIYIPLGFSLLAIALPAITRFLNYLPLAESHASARRKYGKITSEFQSVMAGCSPRQCMQFISDKSSWYADIMESAPPIPLDLWEEAGKEAENVGGDISGNMFHEVACLVEMSDDFLYSDSTIAPMPDQRRWRYSVTNARIRFYQKQLDISFDVEVVNPSTQEKEQYRCQGSGPMHNADGYITYTFCSPANEARWAGIMLLRIPSHGDIYGLWMTTNVNEDDKIPLGKISFHRQVKHD